MRLTTLGDLLLDVVVHANHALTPGDDTVASTRARPGGQAANVAAWAAKLGADARFVGKRGDDLAGRLTGDALRAYGVEVCGPCAGSTGVVVSLTAAGERTMASDRGSATELRPDELDSTWFDCDVLHISGYAIAVEPGSDAAIAAATLARDHGALVSVDISAASLVDDAFRDRLRRIAPDLVFATEPERDAVGGLTARWLVKRGPNGVTVDGQNFPPAPGDVIDPTGAGDAFAAGFFVGGVEGGLTAAAACCAQLGAMP
ncbi:MAG TPA: PfkB family carbohydrate kinase [Gaiellaceae bacterium]|jgi:sugar/nucleoside kinase (ribokinase family)